VALHEMRKDRSVRNAEAGNDLRHGTKPKWALGAILDASTGIRITGALRAVSRYWLPDFVDLHRAHALIVGFHVEPANLEACQIVHEERVDAHTIKGADVAGEQRASLIVAEIEWGERLCRIGFHRRTESMVPQNLTTEMVDRKNRHRRHARCSDNSSVTNR